MRSKTRVDTHQEIKFLFVEGCFLESERKKVEAEAKTYSRMSGKPIVDNVEDAFAIAELEKEMEDIRAQINAIAERIAGAGFPEQVWLRVDEAQVKLHTTGNGSARLTIQGEV